MSDAEEALAFQLRAVGITFAREFAFSKPRRWRADFVLGTVSRPILVEVDGGTWVAGRHTSGTGFAADCMKLNEAAILGYRVLRFTPEMVESGVALTTIERALA
jgi:very-short-patch-repair endonuclease